MSAAAHGTMVGLAAALALTVGAVSPASASVISVSTRFSGAAPMASADAYKTLIDGLVAAAPTSGYCDAAPSAYDDISNQLTCGGGLLNIAFHMHVDFGVAASLAGSWSIRIGPDFGRGGALFIDGTAVAFRSTDMWWDGSYALAEQILTATLPLSSGGHTIDVYGLEGCCDGAQQGQFLAPGSTFYRTFSTTDGLDRAVPVPLPATLPLLGLGLAALLPARRRRA